MENQNIRIHLKAYDNKILDLSTEEIVSIPYSFASRNTEAINGTGVSTAAPADGEILIYNGTSGLWEPAGIPGQTITTLVDNGDGTFTFTLDPAPTENMEYLYTTDGTSYENLIDNAQNAECTDRVDGGRFNTDYFSYANRIWIVGSGDQSETFDSCSTDTIE